MELSDASSQELAERRGLSPGLALEGAARPRLLAASERSMAAAGSWRSGSVSGARQPSATSLRTAPLRHGARRLPPPTARAPPL